MKIIRILGIVVALLIVVIVAIPFLIDVNQFRPRLEAELSAALGRPVSVGDLKLSVWNGSVAADDLSIADDPAFSKTPFVKAKSLGAGIELMPLITSRKVNVTSITIDQPEIDLLQTQDGKWNYATLGSRSAPKPAAAPPATSSSPLDLSVKLVRITNGRLAFATLGGRNKPMILDDVNIELKDFAPSSVMPFSLTAKVAGGGTIALDGKAGPIQDDVERTPMNASLKIASLDLLASGVTTRQSGIAGIAAIDGTAASNGKEFSTKGSVKLEKLELVKGASPATRSVEFDFAARHDLATRAGSLTQGDFLVGKAKASIVGTYVPHGDSLLLKANVTGSEMALQELEGILPALNIVLPAGSKIDGGASSVKLAIEGPIDNLVSTGTLGMNNVKLAGFDLGKKMTVIEMLAGIRNTPTTDIQLLSANVRNSNEGTTIDDLKLIAPDIGELTGSGTVSPDHALDFRMRVSVKAGLIPTALGGRAESGIPFFIRGTAQDPKFEPDVKGMAAGEINNLKGTAAKAAGGLLDQLLNKKKN